MQTYPISHYYEDNINMNPNCNLSSNQSAESTANVENVFIYLILKEPYIPNVCLCLGGFLGVS